MLAHGVGRFSVLGVNVSAVTYADAVSAVVHAAETRKKLTVTALAVHGVMTGVLDATQRFRLNSFDLVCPDGQPVRWALNLLHHTKLTDRVYGPNLTLKICEAAAENGLSVYFYGSKPDVLDALQARLLKRFPTLKIAGVRPSMFRRSTDGEQAAIVDEIRNSGAQIVFAGLGCPRQEVWTFENAPKLNMPVLAVGAAFDFHAGLLPQAPALLQRMGLEWAFRLYQEPKRLWKRYAYLNPAYVFLLIMQATGLRRFKDQGKAPKSDENYA